MQWSRYNLMFKSKRNGWLLYNSGSNSFVQMDEETARVIREIKKDPDTDFSDMPDLYLKLRCGGFLVENGVDDDLFRILKMRRITANYAGSLLLLTIALTKECNFACGYCYEHHRIPSKMTDETEDKLITFIKRQKSARAVSIVWYGGEPLLEFDRIKSLHAKIMETGKKYDSMMVTNGYLLTGEVTDALNDLKITRIQITVDGSKQTHDKRRFLIGGGETYDTIIGNIDALLRSGWKGSLNIRVNIDADNHTDFAEVFRFIKGRYPDFYGKRVSVYPGFVHDDQNPDIGCHFNSGDKGRFLAGLARDYGINALSIFPRVTLGGCTLTKRSAYVVGPDGELYKCWHDVGEEKEVVGSVDSLTDWNMPLIAEGMIGASYLEDKRCQSCFFFPICDGGCPKTRMLNNRDGGCRDTCSYFKKHIKEFLEIHYEQKEAALNE